MQKTRKITWQAIVIIALALLLVLSIALGVSGAWFQDAKTGTATATLGDKVTFTLKEGEAEMTEIELTDVLPGSEIFEQVTLNADTNTSDMHFRVKLDIALYTTYDAENEENNVVYAPAKGDTDYATLMANALTNMGVDTANWALAADNYYYYTKGAATLAIVEAEDVVDFTTGALVVPTSWTNEVANTILVVTINAEAIQEANGAAAAEGWVTTFVVPEP